MAFSVNPNAGSVPAYPPALKSTPTNPPSASPAPSDQVQISAQPASAPPPSPQKVQFENGLQLQRFETQGQLTALYASIPAVPGLVQKPILLSLSVAAAPTNTGAQFLQADAYEVGADGKVLRDAQGQPQKLPVTVFSDGRAYVQSSDDPNAPLVMLDADGSFGASTPARLNVAGDEQGVQGYSREQSEFIKPDGSKGIRLNEQVGGFAQASGFTVNNILKQFGKGSEVSRVVNYTEIQENKPASTGGVMGVIHSQPSLVSQDVSFEQGLGKNWPQMELQKGWDFKFKQTMSQDTRQRPMRDDGHQIELGVESTTKKLFNSFVTGSSGLGLNKWFSKQEVIRFVPLSRQGNTPPQQPVAETPPVASEPPKPAAPPPLPEGF